MTCIRFRLVIACLNVFLLCLPALAKEKMNISIVDPANQPFVGSIPVVSGVPKDAINKTIQDNKKLVMGCYEKGLQYNPKLAGKVSVAFLISAEGTVEKCTVKESTLGDSAVEYCIRDAVAGLKFPKPAAPVTTEVVAYPFYLKPEQKTVFTHKKKNPMIKEEQ